MSISSDSSCELTVVMPAYNEEAAISAVVTLWAQTIEGLDIDYRMIVYDDGSTDLTGEHLAELKASVKRLVIVEQPNAGHGPTVLRGYREARGDWVLQIDSNGELSPSAFEEFWNRRTSFDLLIGDRQQRRGPAVRRVMTCAARCMVRLAFGPDRTGQLIHDVNCPYRLMRRERLLELLPYLGPATFAPNVALSGMAAAAGQRISEVPIEVRRRIAGNSSLRPSRLLGVALESAWQTLITAIRFRQSWRDSKRL